MDEWLQTCRRAAHQIDVYTDVRTNEEHYSTASAVKVARRCLDQLPKTYTSIVRAHGLPLSYVLPCLECARSSDQQARFECVLSVAFLVSTINTEAARH